MDKMMGRKMKNLLNLRKARRSHPAINLKPKIYFTMRIIPTFRKKFLTLLIVIDVFQLLMKLENLRFLRKENQKGLTVM
jgi:hypothetical protein